MIGLLLQTALIFTPPVSTLDALGDSSWQVRERGSAYLASCGWRAYPILWLGAFHEDIEVRKRCSRVPDMWLQWKQEELARAFPRPEDYLFLDSLWIDVATGKHMESELSKLLTPMYCQPARQCVEESFKTMMWCGDRQAFRDFATDCISWGVPVFAIRRLAAELRLRDAAYIAANARQLAAAPQQMPVGPPEQP